ncbi:MAG: PEP-CTERM sorting domain-containing protein [Sedimentisphaerales bacterium]|nr:PEP-CTERM sorting domain-containing protein [Sedimentisphaerales bacterium]
MTTKNALSYLFASIVIIVSGTVASGTYSTPGVPLGNTGWYVYLESTQFGTVQLFDFGVDDENIWLELDKEFTGGFDQRGVGDSIILRFSLADPCAVNYRPNIVIRDERVMNSTGVEWSDFHIALGINPNVSPLQKWGFDPDYIFAPAADNPFESIAFDSASWQGTPYGSYNSTPLKLDMFDTDGQGLPDDDSYYIFGGSSSGHLRIVTSGMVPGDYLILKEWPTIPEPATLSLLALGAMGLLRRKRT